MTQTLDKDEAAILSRALAPENATLSPQAAHSILAIELSDDDKTELRRLADLARDGSLSESEEAELESYRHVGRLLELMKSKARISLKDGEPNA